MAEALDPSTETAAVGVVKSCWRVSRWQLNCRQRRRQWVWWSRAGESGDGGGGGTVDTEVAAERLLESVWRVTGQACGSGCIDKGDGNGCGGAELVRLMQAVRVDASTKAAAVRVLEPSWRVGRW